MRFTGSHPDVYRAGEKHGDVSVDLRHSVSNMTWIECDREIRRMGLLLPTEAQWEYASRAGTTTPWWTGLERESLRGAVNLADQAAKRALVQWPLVADWPDLDDGHVVQAPVDALRPNPWGFHNMPGNVWEWCADEYGAYTLPVEDGTGLRLWKGSPNRVGRGGSFMDAAASARSAHRGAGTTTARQASIGVRPAFPLDGGGSRRR
jgi:formylglycine-generating enzyme required for sulfatase activity